MVEGLPNKAPEPGKARQPLSAARFKATPEYDNFRRGMKQLLTVSKAELDARVRAAKAASPRVGNPNAAGRKKNVPS
jgi:hypothetical protein